MKSEDGHRGGVGTKRSGIAVSEMALPSLTGPPGFYRPSGLYRLSVRRNCKIRLAIQAWVPTLPLT